MEDLSGLTLEQLNWEIVIADLSDCIGYLEETLNHLDRALGNVEELREARG